MHAAECLGGLPEVFDGSKRPWIDPSGAAPERVMEVVRRCPSGALQYEVPGEAESWTGPTSLRPVPGGPIFAHGDLRLATPEGVVTETRAALCSCGQTKNAPFCDLSSSCADWKDTPGNSA